MLQADLGRNKKGPELQSSMPNLGHKLQAPVKAREESAPLGVEQLLPQLGQAARCGSGPCLVRRVQV